MVINANGRSFECTLVNDTAGFSITPSAVKQACVLRHPSLDYEAATSVNVKVRVNVAGESWSSTGGAGYHPEATVTVNINDMNDNSPKFALTPNPSLNMYLGLISVGPESEVSLPNTCLLTVHATDADSGLNGKVGGFYQLLLLKL